MKITLITGATGGLGKELAKLYAQDNNNLLLSGTNESKLSLLKEELSALYPNITIDVVQSNLTQKEGWEKVVAYAKEKEYTVNNLVNNAGFGDQSDFKDMAIQKQIDMINVNCSALTFFTNAYLPSMLENNEGRILNVGSIASFVPGPYMSTYHATKAYVLSLGEAIAYEIRKSKVRITTLCPGPFDSGFVDRAGNHYTFSKIKPVPAEKVAKIGYKASKKGKTFVVAGFKNKVTVFLPRFVTRKFAAAVTGKLGKKNS